MGIKRVSCDDICLTDSQYTELRIEYDEKYRNWMSVKNPPSFEDFVREKLRDK